MRASAPPSRPGRSIPTKAGGVDRPRRKGIEGGGNGPGESGPTGGLSGMPRRREDPVRAIAGNACRSFSPQESRSRPGRGLLKNPRLWPPQTTNASSLTLSSRRRSNATDEGAFVSKGLPEPIEGERAPFWPAIASALVAIDLRYAASPLLRMRRRGLFQQPLKGERFFGLVCRLHTPSHEIGAFSTAPSPTQTAAPTAAPVTPRSPDIAVSFILSID